LQETNKNLYKIIGVVTYMEPKVTKRTYKEIESIFETRRDSISQNYSGKIDTFQDTMELLPEQFFIFPPTL
jgi:hypothetical protein